MTFSGQIDHLSGQIKFGQTNLLAIASYNINGKFIEFAKETECLRPYHKHCSMPAFTVMYICMTSVMSTGMATHKLVATATQLSFP